MGLSRNPDGLEPPEQFRIQTLIYSGLGTTVFALIPFAVFHEDSDLAVAWAWTSVPLMAYALGGILVFPARANNLRASYPELFPIPLIALQSILHFSVLLLGTMVAFGFTDYPANFYTGALIILLIHALIAFVRTLFYRRS
ncbi:MAG: hypothetical protein O2971_02680 [Proteobacteria bacterium]|nr:hypothetical protein [Pseudomonadota bacterium]